MMLSYLKGAYISWRTAAWTSVTYVVIPLLIISIWIPESPVWLVARGRVDEAEESLKWLSGDKVRLSTCISVTVPCAVYLVAKELMNISKMKPT
jgi:predicted MFS family arabinose efflux permease